MVTQNPGPGSVDLPALLWVVLSSQKALGEQENEDALAS